MLISSYDRTIFLIKTVVKLVQATCGLSIRCFLAVLDLAPFPLRSHEVSEDKLFAVMLGGNPAGTSVEIHDVVFAVGPDIESIGGQLLKAWFAPGKAPHVDSWMILDMVDGACISLDTDAAPDGALDLWHVNLGFYEAGKASFVEGHENLFVIASTADEAKARAKQLATRAGSAQLHTDALHRVSDRLAALGSPFRIRVTRTEAAGQPLAHDGYKPFAKDFLKANGFNA
ncbi:MAG: hypothetical protein CGU29_02095 [Candidatus Dactylopiibacterium carminicum]|uniref:DUF1543 domain-containing protein n=1 Tax=Candidatus Dactylopiibacterium carminicum TaxID=857335 RepID=A0A272EXS9_9RHOO|nr:DUF1543 domain-containing protein [Candidatus Dactylopiibacterium carminicum]PAS94927.1 MAG: hypothetical protein CGU29_02095 [Candidatus Dactylopiibacterium carminicum]